MSTYPNSIFEVSRFNNIHNNVGTLTGGIAIQTTGTGHEVSIYKNHEYFDNGETIFKNNRYLPNKLAGYPYKDGAEWTARETNSEIRQFIGANHFVWETLDGKAGGESAPSHGKVFFQNSKMINSADVEDNYYLGFGLKVDQKYEHFDTWRYDCTASLTSPGEEVCKRIDECQLKSRKLIEYCPKTSTGMLFKEQSMVRLGCPNPKGCIENRVTCDAVENQCLTPTAKCVCSSKGTTIGVTHTAPKQARFVVKVPKDVPGSLPSLSAAMNLIASRDLPPTEISILCYPPVGSTAWTTALSSDAPFLDASVVSIHYEPNSGRTKDTVTHFQYQAYSHASTKTDDSITLPEAFIKLGTNVKLLRLKGLHLKGFTQTIATLNARVEVTNCIFEDSEGLSMSYEWGVGPNGGSPNQEYVSLVEDPLKPDGSPKDIGELKADEPISGVTKKDLQVVVGPSHGTKNPLPNVLLTPLAKFKSCTFKASEGKDTIELANPPIAFVTDYAVPLEVESCTFTGTGSNKGGGVYINMLDAGATATFKSTTWTNTFSKTFGGGVFVERGKGIVKVDTCVFTGCSAAQGGSAYFDAMVTKTSILDIKNTTVSENTVEAIDGPKASIRWTGAIFSTATKLMIKSCTMEGNTFTRDMTTTKRRKLRGEASATQSNDADMLPVVEDAFSSWMMPKMNDTALSSSRRRRLSFTNTDSALVNQLTADGGWDTRLGGGAVTWRPGVFGEDYASAATLDWGAQPAELPVDSGVEASVISCIFSNNLGMTAGALGFFSHTLKVKWTISVNEFGANKIASARNTLYPYANSILFGDGKKTEFIPSTIVFGELEMTHTDIASEGVELSFPRITSQYYDMVDFSGECETGTILEVCLGTAQGQTTSIKKHPWARIGCGDTCRTPWNTCLKNAVGNCGGHTTCECPT